MPKGNIVNGKCIYKHGMSKTRFYEIWCGMNKRCHNEKSLAYPNYGGRGIKVCNEWREDFINFKKDMYETYLQHANKYGEKDTSIERIDVNGDYDIWNCAWATRKTQNNNNRRVKKYHFKGSLLSLAEICRLENVEYSLIYTRIRSGWDFERALKAPKTETGKYERTAYHREISRRVLNGNRNNRERDEI